MKFGLTTAELQEIRVAIGKFPEIDSVIIFGSRALGTYKPASDIDLALLGMITLDTISSLKSILEEELTLPYKFDLVNYATINAELKQHIDKHGQEFSRNTNNK